MLVGIRPDQMTEHGLNRVDSQSGRSSHGKQRIPMIPLSSPSDALPLSSDEAPETAMMMTTDSAPWSGAPPPDDASALESYRDYLTLVARRSIGPELAAKFGASDLVQETFLAAQQHVVSFRGRTEPEWRAWLKAILL